MATYAATILADHPAGYFRLDETSGTIANDLSGNGYNATVSGATLSQPGALVGDTDTCMQFTAGGGLTFPPALNPSTCNAATLEYWVNVGSGWHYVAIAIDANGTTLYYDGSATTSSGGSVLVGTNLDFSGSFTSGGYLDEVAIYHYKMSAGTALSHYLAGAASQAKTYVVSIAGSPVFVLAGSLSISSSVGRRSAASFTVRTTTATHFQQYQQVSITDQNGTLVFSGYITQPKAQKPGFQNSLIHSISCADQHFLADKRRVAATYTNKTCGYIAQDLVNQILSHEGVTVGAIYDGLTPSTTLYPSSTLYPGGNVGLIPQVNFVYCKVSEALDSLAQQASAAGVPYYWMIDQYKKLWFVPYTWTTNATVIDGTQIDHVYNPPSVQRQNPTYRNRQYGMGGTQQTVTQTETRKGDGNTQAWTMSFALASTPTITVNSAAKTVGIKGVDSGKDFYWAAGDPIVAQDTSATKLTGTDTLQVVYIGQYPAVVIAENDAQVALQASIDGTSGIIEEVDVDATQTSIANSFSKVGQLLTRYATQGIILEFTTQQTGFDQGQLATVNLPMFDLINTQMLIEEVTASDQTDAQNIWYTVKAIQGPYDTTWVDFFSKLLTQQQTANSINIGVGQSVTLLQSFTATATATATLNVSVYACPLPSATQYPSSTLYPC